MRILVIGAGASVAEGLAAGNAFENCLPVMSNFAKKTWQDFNPHPHLDRFVESLGYIPIKGDARPLFYELEASGITNVERFFEYAWANKDKSWNLSEYELVKSKQGIAIPQDTLSPSLPNDFIKGFRIRSAGQNSITVEPAGEMSFWENMLSRGIGSPISMILMNNFHENGKGFKQLKISQAVARNLCPFDIVLNLNYDTIFEIALEQIQKPFVYSPYESNNNEIEVCKPHGSLNLVLRENSDAFAFGQPTWLGSPEPPGGRSFQGFIPPRFTKCYKQNPIAYTILNSLKDKHPKVITFWGIGLTGSDADLLSLYRAWIKRGSIVEVINPDFHVADKANKLLNCKVQYFVDTTEWLDKTNI